AETMGSYLRETILRLSCDLERDSAYKNLPIYYEQGTKRHVAPDVFFLPGVPYEPDLKSYLLWKTDVPPAVAFEIVSPGNEYKDVVRNREIYARLGIGEYYWFNPDSGELAAFHLDPATGEYRPLEPDALGRYFSPALGLHVGLENGRIALYHEGRYVPPTEELRKEAELRYEEAERRCKEEQRRCKEEQRRREEEQRRREDADRARAEEQRRREEADRVILDLERRLKELQGDGA
ncbi:MAG: Uma2 family endonuclease, partial [Planctomycetes bacterium]|nr:Uma2 family endonuclease [Planctomycetota bacterium]